MVRVGFTLKKGFRHNLHIIHNTNVSHSSPIQFLKWTRRENTLGKDEVLLKNVTFLYNQLIFLWINCVRVVSNPAHNPTLSIAVFK